MSGVGVNGARFSIRPSCPASVSASIQMKRRMTLNISQDAACILPRFYIIDAASLNDYALTTGCDFTFDCRSASLWTGRRSPAAAVVRAASAGHGDELSLGPRGHSRSEWQAS